MGNRQVDPEVQLGRAGPPLTVTKRSFAYDRTERFYQHLCVARPPKRHIFILLGGLRHHLRRIYIYIYIHIHMCIYIYIYTNINARAVRERERERERERQREIVEQEEMQVTRSASEITRERE